MYRKRLEVFLFFCHIPLLAFVNLWLNPGFLFPEKISIMMQEFIYIYGMYIKRKITKKCA